MYSGEAARSATAGMAEAVTAEFAHPRPAKKWVVKKSVLAFEFARNSKKTVSESGVVTAGPCQQGVGEEGDEGRGLGAGGGGAGGREGSGAFGQTVKKWGSEDGEGEDGGEGGGKMGTEVSGGGARDEVLPLGTRVGFVLKVDTCRKSAHSRSLLPL
jgi:hypothetical protein